jgi:nucleotide-binding universal stress UspA family protein
MLPFKKILCPTDFSEPSYEAIKTAGELAYHFASELCIIHVVSPVPLMPIGVEPTAFNVVQYEEELMVSSRRSLEEVLSHLETKEVKTRLVVVRGNAADEIVHIADEENVDLIVIATRGRTGLDRLIFGSVAEKVVRLAKSPVLTVSSRPERGELSPNDVESPGEKSEKKKAFQEKIEVQLREWGAKIEELKTRAEKSKADLKIKYEKQIQDLQVKQAVVQQRLRELRESGENVWEELKTGVEKSLDDLKGSLDHALLTFKEKGEEAMETVSKKRKAYVEKMEVQLKEWGIQIDVLKAKAEKSKAEVKIKYLEQVEELRKKQKTARQRLRELKGSGEEAWGEFKVGLDKALEDLEEAFDRSKSKFLKK